MNDTEEARQRWLRERPDYQAFGELIQGRLKQVLKPLGIWFTTSARAKETDSLVKKLLLKQTHTYDSLPDKVGVRVIVKFRLDIDHVVEKTVQTFDCDKPDDKTKNLGIDRVGYQSVHLDKVRLRQADAEAIKYPPSTYWVELQIRTLAQHLWSEMSHDSVYKNDEMVSALPEDLQRRVNLMAGQVEVADREFERLNSDIEVRDAVRLLRVLERHYYTLTSRQPNLELSVQVLDTLLPLVKGDIAAFADHLNHFLSSKHAVLETVYSEAADLGIENTTAFLFQPEVLLIYDLLTIASLPTQRLWSQNYPEPELERIANAFGLSLD